MLDDFRRVFFRGPAVRAKDGKVVVRGLYVRKDLPLPEIDEEIVLINEQTRREYIGVVITVNPEAHTYDARFTLVEIGA